MTARVLVWLFTAIIGLAPLPAGALESFETTSLVIETAGGGSLKFRVELALSPAQQAQGLMFRQKLAPDAGMLFVYETPQAASFWMQNTYVSLDMLFVGEDGRIELIHEKATPLSTKPINGPARTKAVLEVVAGTAARLGIRVGDKVIHRLLGAAR